MTPEHLRGEDGQSAARRRSPGSSAGRGIPLAQKPSPEVAHFAVRSEAM